MTSTVRQIQPDDSHLSKGSRAALYLLSGQLAVAIFALATNVFAARALGPSGRGDLAFYLQVSYVLTAVGLMGMDRAYPASGVAATRFPQAVRDVNQLICKPSILGSVLAALVVSLILGPTAVVMAIGVAVLTIGNVYTAGLRSASAASSVGRVFLLVNVVGQGAVLLAAASLTAFQVGNLTVWILAYAAGVAVPVLATFTFIVKGGSGTRLNGGLARARRLGLALLPSSLASIVAMRADRLMLPWLAGAEQLGIYIVVATVCEMIAWPAQAWTDAHVARWRSATLVAPLPVARIVILACAYAVCACLVVLLAIHVLLIPVFGSEYRASLGLAVPLAAASSAYAISRVVVGVALAQGKPAAPVWTDCAAMMVGVISYLCFIPSLGALGAAVGSLLSYSAAALVCLLLICSPRPAHLRENPAKRSEDAVSHGDNCSPTTR